MSRLLDLASGGGEGEILSLRFSDEAIGFLRSLGSLSVAIGLALVVLGALILLADGS